MRTALDKAPRLPDNRRKAARQEAAWVESCVTYLGEFRRNARPLLAASLGSGTSLSLFAYTNSVFAPHLVKEFGWSRSQFALIGAMTLTTLLVLPFAGRFTDSRGVRPVALTGTLLVPLGFVGYAMQNGEFLLYAAVYTFVLGVGALTSPLVYTRLIAESFDRATGLALTVVNCVPAVLAIVLVPLLNQGIEQFGWRNAYLALGAFNLVCGLIAVALVPRRAPNAASIPVTAAPAASASVSAVSASVSTAREDYRLIFSSRVFWVILFGMFLCLLQLPIHSSQMSLMLVDNGISTNVAASIVPIYALGTIVGRISCGLALDRFATPPVAAISLLLPALGFVLLGTDINTVTVVSVAMFLVGLSIGAESDLITYLIARYFKLRIYATALGLLFCVSFVASAVGAIVLSRTLVATGSFSAFLYFLAGAVVVGSLLFLLMPWSKDVQKIG